ncbi:MAG: peptidylprolyl isomerase [Candidatus Margulisiibacteriota bacterium]
MLTYLRKNMKTIIMVVAILFVFSMFYGLGYSALQSRKTSDQQGFLKIDGKKVDPRKFMQIYTRLKANVPGKLKPQDELFLQNMALGQTIDTVIILDEANRKVKVSGAEINKAIEDIAQKDKFNSVSELKATVEKSGTSWNEFKKLVKEEIMVQKMMERVRGEVKVSPNDLREIRARHILIRVNEGGEEQAKKTVDDVMARVKKGADFASLARKYSEDPGSKEKGGDLGYFTTGAMVKPFEDVAFSLKAGEIGGPVKTDFGYHIIRLEDTRLRKVGDGKNLEAEVLKEKQDRAFRDWFFEKKKNSRIEILDPSLRAADYRYKGQMGPAAEEYQKAIAQNPGNPYFHLFLGNIYEETGKLDLAILQYQEAAKLGPGDPEFNVILGNAYIKAGKKDLAIEQFKRASMLAADNKAYHEELLKLFGDLNLYDLVKQEKDEIARVIKKEAFEESLRKEAESKAKIVTE